MITLLRREDGSCIIDGPNGSLVEPNFLDAICYCIRAAETMNLKLCIDPNCLFELANVVKDYKSFIVIMNMLKEHSNG
jgi:hypothetical protein